MSKVSGSKGSTSSAVSSTPQPTGPVQATPTAKAPPPSAQENLDPAAKGLLSRQSSPLVSGAMKIFGDNVVLPAGLTDPKNPQNDVKYLRLLSAVLGLDELERHFYTLEGKKQEEYLQHKAEQRERKWAKIEKEKEEKRRQKQEAEPETEEESE